MPASGITGTIADEQRIVALIRENQPFDHYFGTLRGVRELGDHTPSSASDWQESGMHSTMRGRRGIWPQFKTSVSIGYYLRQDIPFQFALADAFTICDAHYCSATTGTDHQRLVLGSHGNSPKTATVHRVARYGVGSMSGTAPPTRPPRRQADPAASVQPRWPWPVLT